MAEVRAAVLVAPMTIELRAFPRPAVETDSALLRVASNGICGSDVAWRAKAAAAPNILGHEVVGRIAEIGSRAADLWQVGVGDLVAVVAGIRCGSCAGCVRGAGCLSARNYGAQIGIDIAPALWGGLAEYMYLAPGTVVTRLRDGLPPDVAAGWFSPLANAVDWVGELGAAPSRATSS
jgi:threonine dehydrogenase-like Zn-dependent dehydrogenase